MSKAILITGGAGFVGSSLAIRLKENYPAYRIVALDNLKRRGSELNLARIAERGVEFIHGDIRNVEDFEAAANIDVIIDASAEPSVLSGVNGSPDYVINTNLLGTVNCLNFAVKNRANLIFLSSSRVYPIEPLEAIAIGETDTRFTISPKQSLPGISELGISESFPLVGYRSFYGATKLCSELLIGEYCKFYKLKAVINRCGVITGPWQMGKSDQGFVVLWIARHFWERRLAYLGYGGRGKQVRDILHIDDLYRLIDLEIHTIDGVNGNIFNVGGGAGNSVSLLELTAFCQKLTGKVVPIESESRDRDADIRLYITDNTTVTAATNWKPEISVEQILESNYRWISDNHDSLQHILDR